MIEIKRIIAIGSPSDAVWRVISSPAVVVSCVPGASLDSEVTGGSFSGRITVAFGALRVPFRGSGMLVTDESALRGTLTGQGRDNNGGTRFKLSAEFAVQPAADGTCVLEVDSRVDLSGKLAPLIEAGAEVVIESMTAMFAEQLAVACGPAPVPAAAIPADEPSSESGTPRRRLSDKDPAPPTASPAPGDPARVPIPGRVLLRAILAALMRAIRSAANRLRKRSRSADVS